MDQQPPAAPEQGGTGTLARRWYRPRWWWSIPAVVIALVVGVALSGALSGPTGPTDQAFRQGGGSSGSVTTSSEPDAVGTGYLASGPDEVIFIQLTVTNSDLSGSAQVETLEGTPPNATVHTQTISVTGSESGSTITLSFDGETQVFGTLSGGSFTVTFPQNDGSLAPVTFSSASASQFNQALSQLQGTTGSADQSAAAAETITSEQTSIDRWSSRVSADISGLQGDESQLSKDLGGFGGNLATEKSDLAAVAAQEQMVITEAHNGTDPSQVCSDSDTDQSDADTVGSDGDSVSSTADGVEGDLSTVRNDVSGLNSDFSSLQGAQAQQPGYNDGAPSSKAVAQAGAAAQAAINAALTEANADIAQANSYETQATADATAAAQAGNCSGPANQATQPTIA